MRKIVIIILALVVALGALPVTFACYNGGWGNWHYFWRPHQPVYCCPTNCNLIFTDINAYDNENEDNFTEPKEVGQTTACITCCGKKITITIDNAYPGYEGIVDFCVKNTGSRAATITGFTPDYPDPIYLQIGLTGEVYKDAVIQPCSKKCGQLVIGGIPQLEDAQNRHFTFDINMNYSCTCTPPGGGCGDGCYDGHWDSGGGCWHGYWHGCGDGYGDGGWSGWGGWGGWGGCYP